ncbi:MAG: hypothetical protein ACREJC_14040, partial [Tepidisphaeraceae bacterium]
AWSAVDPVTGFPTAVSFVADLATPVVGANVGSGGVNIRGAEIDLFGSNNAGFWDVGDPGLRAEVRFSTVPSAVTLTSGTANYAGSSAISGADVIINSNTAALYDLDTFRRLLTHEIGHTIGLGDVEGDINFNAFIDDDYDGSSSASALATLTNSWAAKVNPLNPGASVGLARYTVPAADPGTVTDGVNILMESYGLGISPENPVTNLIPLTNDDYATRQFLYPMVPEPAGVCAISCMLALAMRIRRHAMTTSRRDRAVS